MKPTVKIILGISILLVGVLIAGWMINTKPKADEVTPGRNPPPVEVVVAQRSDFPVQIVTQGELMPERETAISAEVGGRVVSVAERFKVGERFEEGELLLEIDAADYRAAEASAKAEVANANLAIAQERAMAAQALRDWKVLGSKGEAGDLVLRKPHLLSAEARLAAAEAALAKAGRDLERATVRAPYACQIKSTRTEIGAYIGAGSPLAEVFSTGDLEVRLAVDLEDFAYVKIGDGKVPVRLSSRLGREELFWDGEVLRTEGRVDRASRSVFLVAVVSPEKSEERAGKFLVPGLFVRAVVEAGVLPDVFRLPRKALYGKDKILIVSPENRVSFRVVKILRTSRNEVVIGAGIEPGERIAVSPLPQVIDNMEVSIAGQSEIETESEAEEGSDP
jgi:RND family efflux transporter MFP subunit